ncbi:MAG: hypothetical protein AAFP20_12755 [Cyanobacteria bacterium J06614_10]
MTDSSTKNITSLTSLLAEIEATPREYWAELLDTLRQFRQKLPAEPHSAITESYEIIDESHPIINEEQAKKNQAAIDLMNSWLENDDEKEHQETWEFLKKALDEDRLSNRPLFP